MTPGKRRTAQSKVSGWDESVPQSVNPRSLHTGCSGAEGGESSDQRLFHTGIQRASQCEFSVNSKAELCLPVEFITSVELLTSVDALMQRISTRRYEDLPDLSHIHSAPRTPPTWESMECNADYIPTVPKIPHCPHPQSSFENAPPNQQTKGRSIFSPCVMIFWVICAGAVPHLCQAMHNHIPS